MPPSTIAVIHELRCFVVERARTTRRFIKLTEPPYSISDLEILELDKEGSEHIPELMKLFKTGQSIGLMSESGMPAIADPGSEVVAIAHKLNYNVKPLVGPSSIFLALAASGLNGQNFCFCGYLPIKDGELKSKLREIENRILNKNQTIIFIETPYRNKRIFEALLKFLSGNIKLCVAADLTGKVEKIKTHSIADWKSKKIELEKVPTIFLVG